MEFSGISQFLEKYRKQIFGEEERRKALAGIVLQCTNIALDEKNIRIKNGVAHLSVNPMIRGEIFLYKEKILAAAKEQQIKIGDIQ